MAIQMIEFRRADINDIEALTDYRIRFLMELDNQSDR